MTHCPICYFAVSQSHYGPKTIEVSVNRNPTGPDEIHRYEKVTRASAHRIDRLFAKANYYELPGCRLIVWISQHEVKAVLTNA